MTHSPIVDPATDRAPERRRALVITAHPDDADFGAAGTIALWAAKGVEVTILVCTRGDQGGAPDEDMSTMTARREQEQKAASAELGVSDVRFLDGYRDGWMEPSYALQRDITRVIRQVRPHRVLTQSPERHWDRLFASHPDHLAVGEATVRAVYPAAENPHAWPELVSEEGLAPYKVPEMWLMGHPTSNVTVDITDVFDKKLAALTRHVSQVGSMPEDELRSLLWSWGSTIGEEGGLGAGRVAEAFRRVSVNG